MLKRWEDLPSYMQTPEVEAYYRILAGRRGALALKRCFDLVLALLMTMLLLLPMGTISLLIRLDSKGPVLFRQARVTTGGKVFYIHKFRTMVADAERLGSAVTVADDRRVTRVGGFLRRFRLDEFPQLLDVLAGNMSFVGTRPEVEKYVSAYEPSYYATLLLPAGITSEASLRFKDEAELLQGAEDPDRAYLDRVLPEKMRWNLASIRNFSLGSELRTLVRTVASVCGREYGRSLPDQTGAPD